VIVKGQCTLDMKNKVEILKDRHLIEANDDSISKTQQDNELLAESYKRFTSCVDVGESEWGTPVPTAAATNETNDKTSRDKFITCVFLQEWIPKGMES
jgi:hypothetical protein